VRDDLLSIGIAASAATRDPAAGELFLAKITAIGRRPNLNMYQGMYPACVYLACMELACMCLAYLYVSKYVSSLDQGMYLAYIKVCI
jgi:hypothetical protein